MHPILFKIPLPNIKLPLLGYLGSFPVYSSGVFLALALIFGWYLSLGLAKKDGLPRDTMANNYVFTAIAGLLGARILFVVLNPNEVHSVRDVFAVRSGGLNAYGAFLGGLLGSWWYCRRKGIRLWAWADVAAPSLAIGTFFTRIGCYLFGCEFGKRMSDQAPNWIKKIGTFPEWHYDHRAGKWLNADGLRSAFTQENASPQIISGSPAWLAHREADASVVDMHHSFPVHPTQLYEALTGLLLFALLWMARKNALHRMREKQLFFRGETFLLFVFSYGISRFLGDIVRDEATRGLMGPYADPHVIYPLGLLVLSFTFIYGFSLYFSERVRPLLRVIAVLLPLALFFILRPNNPFAHVVKVRLSAAQWIAIVSSIIASITFKRFLEGAKASPTWAASLGEGVKSLLAQEDESKDNPEKEGEIPAEKDVAQERDKASKPSAQRRDRKKNKRKEERSTTKKTDSPADHPQVVVEQNNAIMSTLSETPKAKKRDETPEKKDS